MDNTTLERVQDIILGVIIIGVSLLIFYGFHYSEKTTSTNSTQNITATNTTTSTTTTVYAFNETELVNIYNNAYLKGATDTTNNIIFLIYNRSLNCQAVPVEIPGIVPFQFQLVRTECCGVKK